MAGLQRGRLRRLLTEGKPAIGTAVGIPHAYAVEQVARAGFDWVFIDMQHGMPTYRDLPDLCFVLQAHGVSPIVRIPYGDNAGAQRALDAGAEGIIFPYIEDASGAAEAARACRYPPEGIRSFGPYRSPYGSDIEVANEEILCIVMIESRSGVENLETITSTEEVDAIFIGPSDLSISFGGSAAVPRPFDTDASRSTTAVPLHNLLLQAVKTSRESKMFSGVSLASGSSAASAFDAGFHFVSIGGDSAFLRAGGVLELERAGRFSSL